MDTLHAWKWETDFQSDKCNLNSDIVSVDSNFFQ